MQEKMLVEYDNARVLITDMKIEAIKDIIPLLEQVTRINQPLVIIAEDVTGAPSAAAAAAVSPVAARHLGASWLLDTGTAISKRSQEDYK